MPWTMAALFCTTSIVEKRIYSSRSCQYCTSSIQPRFGTSSCACIPKDACSISLRGTLSHDHTLSNSYGIVDGARVQYIPKEIDPREWCTSSCQARLVGVGTFRRVSIRDSQSPTGFYRGQGLVPGENPLCILGTCLLCPCQHFHFILLLLFFLRATAAKLMSLYEHEHVTGSSARLTLPGQW
jgi:hypothetical protein